MALAAGLQARQREYLVGASIDVLSGGDSGPLRSVGSSEDMNLFYGLYPSIRMTATGARSTIGMSYAFGFDSTQSDPKFRTESHNGTFNVSRALGPTSNLSLSDSIRVTSDASTFNASRGVITTPGDGFDFVFDPVTTGRSVVSNTASIALDFGLGSRSSINLGGSHSLRRYEGGRAGLADQQYFSANIAYDHQLTSQTSWNVRYTVGYSDFQGFRNVTSHNAQLGLSTEFARDWVFSVGAGESYVLNQGGNANYLGHTVSTSLAKNIDNTSISIYYTQVRGESTGLGAASDTRRGGVGVTLGGRGLNVFLDASVFDSSGVLDNPFNTRGVSGSATLGYAVSDNLSIHGGFRYYEYSRTAEYAFRQERAYITLRLTEPELWRSR